MKSRSVLYTTITLLVITGLFYPLTARSVARQKQDSAPPPPKTKINPKDGAIMVFVPAGEFLMGSTYDEMKAISPPEPPNLPDPPSWNGVLDVLNPGGGRINTMSTVMTAEKMMAHQYDHEMPQRKVYLDGYWIYKNDVTVAQYRKFCEATGHEMPQNWTEHWREKAPKEAWYDDHPIIDVSWDDAVAYCQWAGVRLPTEAEWEKAARGTEGWKYPWGNAFDGSRLWRSKSSAGHAGRTAPAGSYPAGASPYGCLDMAGNVWQWCADWFESNYYRVAPGRNPQGPITGLHSMPEYRNGSWSTVLIGFRVIRGGAWCLTDPVDFRTACRGSKRPDNSDNYTGFRCASGQ